jgi:hypothetical protein
VISIGRCNTIYYPCKKDGVYGKATKTVFAGLEKGRDVAAVAGGPEHEGD